MTANDELVLRWSGGSIDLMGWNDGPHGPYKIQTLPSGTDWGNPEPVRRALRRFMLDGSTSVKEYDDNRTIPLALRVTAPDGNALAGAEVPLALADDRRCELVWTPKDTRAPAAVFVATSIDLTRKQARDAGDPLGEGRLRRYYTLTLDALPHALSDEWVTVPALVPGASTPTLVDDCSTTTGWTATGATFFVGSGWIRADADSSSSTFTVTRTGAIDLTTEPYLSVHTSGPTSPPAVEVQDSAGAWTTIPVIGMDGSAHIFDATAVPDPTITAVRFTAQPATSMTFLDVSKQATPMSYVGRGQVRTLAVPGSRRTPATLLLESPSTQLGTVMVYAGPNYNPGLIRGLVGGSAVFSTSAPLVLEVPAADFHSGSHALWIHSSPTGAPPAFGKVTPTVTLRTAAGATIATTVLPQTTLGPNPAMVLLGVVDLPGAVLPAGTTAVVRVELAWADPGGSSGTGLVELLALNVERGTLTVAEAGAHQKLWLDSPSLERDHPIVYAGSGDKADARPLSLLSELPAWPGVHRVEPPTTYLYTASTVATDLEVSALFRPAWHTHPAAL